MRIIEPTNKQFIANRYGKYHPAGALEYSAGVLRRTKGPNVFS